MPSRLNRFSFVRFFVLCATASYLALSCNAEGAKTLGHLRMVSSDFANGNFVGCLKPGHIAWQCDAFDRPLLIDVIHLKRLETGVLLSPIWEDGSFDFDVNGSESLRGLLIESVGEDIKIRNQILGDVRIPLSRLTQMRRIDTPRDVLFEGLASDSRLRDLAEKNGWQLSGQSLVADKPSARFSADVHLAMQSIIELRLSWEGQPQFVIAIGVDDHQSSISNAPRIEVWDRQLVLVQQSNGKADLTPLRNLSESDSEIALKIYQDQSNGQIAVFSNSGSLLGKIRLQNQNTETRSSIAFSNQGPSCSIDLLTVSQWNGLLPYPYGAKDSGVPQARRNFTGTLKSYDSKTDLITIQTKDSKEATFPLTELSTFVPDNASRPSATQTSDAGSSRIQLTLKDGSQITGELLPADIGKLNIQPKYSEQAYTCRADQVLSIRKLSDAITALPLAAKRMKLRMDGIELSGHLADMPAVDSNAMLRFQPSVADAWVGIRETAHGTISPSRANTTQTPAVTELRIQGNARIFLPAAVNPANQPDDADSSIATASSFASAYRTPRGLQLRSGELMDAVVDSIDESGIKFDSFATSTTFLPHQVIHSVQLKVPMRGVPIDVKKMERLLTVPRMRRDNPPTHLLITTSGDYLRGRLKRMTQETVEFDEGDTPLIVPRISVAVIIWLHDRQWEGEQPNEQIEGEEAFQVHLRSQSMGRFTFKPERIEHEKLFGTSPLLGAVNCPLSKFESLEFGKNMIQRMAASEENAWRLSLAKSPMVFEATDENGIPMTDQLGKGSDLVGKPAPNFELKSVIGKPWRLSDQIGKAMVLDFWASWCGPCMHAMPQVERVVTDLNSDDIVWVGINIQETPERVQASVDRLNIQSLVLLDSEGSVGSEYEAQAIPLTVIIDRQGIVRHVFIGGGGDTLAGIEKAIRSLNEENAKAF